MKSRKSYLCIAAAFVLLTTSCGDQTNDSKEMAEEANDQKFDNNMERDAEFVTKAADGGMMEVQLGQLAQSKATTPEAKEFAAMMVADHSKANEELKNLAAQKGISVPAALSNDKQEMYDDMSKKTGADFDKAYISHMVKDHKEDIELFRKEAENGNDVELKNWASGKLPILEHHLQMAQRADSVLSK